MKLYTITYIRNGKECVEQVSANSLDAAVRYCGVKPGELLDVEESMKNYKKGSHIERKRLDY